MTTIVVNQSNIQEAVINGSLDKNVLLYIFDPQNPVSTEVTNSLRSAISPLGDSLVLAEADAHDPIIQQVCIQLGVQSLPAICVFSQGRPIDLITAERLQNPQMVNEAIKNYLPSEEQLLIAQAQKLAAENKFSEAFQIASQALEKAPKEIAIRFLTIEYALKCKKVKQARAYFDEIDANNRVGKDYQDLLSALTLAESSLENPETKLLEEQLAAEPQNIELVEKLATAWSQEGKSEEALNLLLKYLKQDLNLGNLKKIYIDILSTMSGDPLQAQFRRKLYTLMY